MVERLVCYTWRSNLYHGTTDVIARLRVVVCWDLDLGTIVNPAFGINVLIVWPASLLSSIFQARLLATRAVRAGLNLSMPCWSCLEMVAFQT
jgi:hypothetical protein